MGRIFQMEPARITGAITNFIAAAIMLFAAFGLEISEDQRNAILAAIAPTVLVIQMMFEMVRKSVVPVAKAQPLIQTALRQDPNQASPQMIQALESYDVKGARQIERTEAHGAIVVPDADPNMPPR